MHTIPSPSRLADLRPWTARLALILLLAIGCAFAADDAPQLPVISPPARGDAALYRSIDRRLLAGQDYYHAAAAEQRARGFPLRPFVTVRLPTLAWVTRAAGSDVATLWVLRLVACCALAAGAIRLAIALRAGPLCLVAGLSLALAIGSIAQPEMIFWHEAWSGLLIVLSLSCRSARLWWPAVLFGLGAVLFRELALPYLVAMIVMALRERRRGEAIGWGLAIIAACAAIMLHGMAVAAVVRPGDLASPGWEAFGGWRFDLKLLRDTSLFAPLPREIGGPLVALSLVGWGTWRNPLATRFAAALTLWLGAFLFIGRPVNFYWGLMIAPLLPIGLPLAVPALRDLVRAAFQGSTASFSSWATSPPRPESTPFAE